MIYSPNLNEFNAVLCSSLDKRVKNFKNMVAGHEYFWTCIDEDGGFLVNKDTHCNECLLLWPAKEYAIHFLGNSYQDVLQYVEIHEFLENSIEYLDENNIKLMVFPTKDDGGALFEPNDFKIMMEGELARYGDYDDE